MILFLNLPKLAQTILHYNLPRSRILWRMLIVNPIACASSCKRKRPPGPSCSGLNGTFHFTMQLGGRGSHCQFPCATVHPRLFSLLMSLQKLHVHVPGTPTLSPLLRDGATMRSCIELNRILRISKHILGTMTLHF